MLLTFNLFLHLLFSIYSLIAFNNQKMLASTSCTVVESDRLHDYSEPSTSQQADLCSERLPTRIPTTVEKESILNRRPADRLQRNSFAQRRPSSMSEMLFGRSSVSSILFLLALSVFASRVEGRSVGGKFSFEFIKFYRPTFYIAFEFSRLLPT